MAPPLVVPAGPVLDKRVRWRADRIFVGALAASVHGGHAGAAPDRTPRRPCAWRTSLALRPGGRGHGAAGEPESGQPRPSRSRFYAFLRVLGLDGSGPDAAPLGWPIWPVMALLIGALAVAERPPRGPGCGGPGRRCWPPPRPLRASSPGGLRWRRPRLRRAGPRRQPGAEAREARLAGQPGRVGAPQARHRPAGDSRGGAAGLAPAHTSLRQVSEEGRGPARWTGPGSWTTALPRIVQVARAALDAHAVLYFDVDRDTGTAHLRAATAPRAW